MVQFSNSGAVTVWMNFTVAVGGLSVYQGQASIVIKPMGIPPCAAYGGVQSFIENRSAFQLFNPGSWQIAFINYGPSAGSIPTVSLTWISPLEVIPA